MRPPLRVSIGLALSVLFVFMSSTFGKGKLLGVALFLVGWLMFCVVDFLMGITAGYSPWTNWASTFFSLEVLANKAVGAILLDLLMPGMDGFEVIRHVRQEVTLKDLPILIMTGKNLTAEEAALLSRETQALLQKNGSWQQQLIAEVRRVIEGSRLAKAAGQS
jgi:CheY-like chemotaxis protein